MKPRTIHLLILSVLCVAPAGLGIFFVVKGETSHNEFAALGVALGLGLLGASAFYALVSSLLVWKLGESPSRVWVVHGGIIGSVLGLLMVTRLVHLVAP